MTMRRQAGDAIERQRWLAAAMLVALCSCIGVAQTVNSDPATKKEADTKKLPAEKGDVLDRVVAIVNGDLVLESDIDEEMRFEALQPFQAVQGGTLRDRALNRLIDRTLIQQQERGLSVAPTADEDVDAQIADLRTGLPVCAHDACKTDTGWKRVLAEKGFTPEELRARWKLRMQLLGFIEQRFRAGVRISDAEVEKYYTERMLPEYKKRNAPAPPLESISDRVEEILLQQQVSALLVDWLKSLRTEGGVRILKQGEEAP